MKSLRTFLTPMRLQLILAILLVAAVAGIAYADVPGRIGVRGTVPNPGTQQQELANITFPSPYNTYEFVVTCMACHGGSIDQQAGHGGNWAGSNMASSARDPVFRANEIAVNATIKSLTGKDGAGNMCFRCHSPNGWMSGRFDPTLAGEADGSSMIQSILLSTDSEGIMCEACHRAIGNVTMQRADLDPADPVWKMMASIDDWPHAGGPYVDQAGDATIAAGNPYGDTTLQIMDGMSYNGRYSGSVALFFNDQPILDTTGTRGGLYTGQTWGVYPQGWQDNLGNDVSGQPAVSPDGSIPLQFEVPIGPPGNPPNYSAQSVSLEHPTFASNGEFASEADFIQSSEFCGSCHDLTVPVLNHGMPEQRTYTEWKYSDFGTGNVTCQSCHMPRMKHEFEDATPVTLNVDPIIAGWFPYAKPRDNTAFHKFNGSNRDLPEMMKVLYPEVDLEVIGAPTGNDTRVFPGMLSDRRTMWDRARRNTEIALLDAVDVQIASAPTYDAATGKWSVQVKVTNNTGHRIPSGYPDGRRLWLGLEVTDETGAVVYESGFYDGASAQLFTDSALTPLNRAVEPLIDGDNNAVMIYERVTGTCQNGNHCTPSPSLLNDKILFDNRIPPAGFSYNDYRNAGIKFWNYAGGFVPYEDLGRYPDGQNFDLVTYTFTAPATAILNVRAEAYWETHTREFMEHLKNNDTSTVRPEGPPSIYEPNYPLTPNYLSDVIGLAGMTDLDGQPLRDNWGGIAYAAWLLTGKGAPYLVAAADTAQTTPAAPANVFASPIDPFTIEVSWDAVPGADGYLVWTRYGAADATASWDKLAVVYGTTTFLNEALNVAKTYAYKVQAFNGAGYSPESVAAVTSTPADLPLPPENLKVLGTTATTVDLSWFDGADNEDGFVIERQDVPVVGNFYEIARIPSQTAGVPTGGNNWTDTTAQPGLCYNYRVAAYNASGMSTYNVNGPVQACTGGPPTGTIVLTAVAVSGTQVDLSWSGAAGQIDGYRIERSTAGATGPWTTTFGTAGTATGYSDLTVQPNTTYWYRVFAYNLAGDSAPSNVANVTTPGAPPAAPTNLTAAAPVSTRVDLTWTDNANNESGFAVERSTDGGATWTEITRTGANATTFSDTTVQPKMTYDYRVYAFNGGGPSGYSNVATVVTPGEIPQAPSELRVRKVTRNSVELQWRDNANNEQGFYVERSVDGAVTWTRIATLGRNSKKYTDKGLTSNTTYWYRVQAYNADGVSEYSETVSATTK